MLVQALVVVALALLRLGGGEKCGVVVLSQDELKEEIRSEVSVALATAVGNITEYQDHMKEEIKQYVWAAMESATMTIVSRQTREIKRALENITDTVEQLLVPLLSTSHRPPGSTPDHPATSCEAIRRHNSSSHSGYYWIQSRNLPLVQVYCDMHTTCLGETRSNPASSCKEIKEHNPDCPSGYYWVKDSNEQTIRVYCDMDKTCGGITGGWARVVSLDMTNTSQTCPSGLNLYTSGNKRLCQSTRSGRSCSSTTFDVHGIEYTHVCGKIISYQWGSPEAFYQYYIRRNRTVDDVYIDGISLTHGHNPRKHIWSFAAAVSETHTNAPHMCPCTNDRISGTILIPPYVGNDYFCDTGNEGSPVNGRLYPNDPLWDGQGCGPHNTCCSFNNPPWFHKELPEATADDIEMRLCNDESPNTDDTPVEAVELYVQ